MFCVKESNGPTDGYAAISQVDRLQSEPESIRKWREEQTERLEALGKELGGEEPIHVGPWVTDGAGNLSSRSCPRLCCCCPF